MTKYKTVDVCKKTIREYIVSDVNLLNVIKVLNSRDAATVDFINHPIMIANRAIHSTDIDMKRIIDSIKNGTLVVEGPADNIKYLLYRTRAEMYITTFKMYNPYAGKMVFVHTTNFLKDIILHKGDSELSIHINFGGSNRILNERTCTCTLTSEIQPIDGRNKFGDVSGELKYLFDTICQDEDYYRDGCSVQFRTTIYDNLLNPNTNNDINKKEVNEDDTESERELEEHVSRSTNTVYL